MLNIKRNARFSVEHFFGRQIRVVLSVGVFRWRVENMKTDYVRSVWRFSKKPRTTKRFVWLIVYLCNDDIYRQKFTETVAFQKRIKHHTMFNFNVNYRLKKGRSSFFPNIVKKKK